MTDGLAAEDYRVGVVEDQAAQLLLHTLRFLFLERFFAHKVCAFVQRHGKPQPCFVGCVIGGDVSAPVAVAFLEAQGFDGLVPAGQHAVRFTGLPERIPKLLAIFRWRIEFPAQLADIGNT